MISQVKQSDDSIRGDKREAVLTNHHWYWAVLVGTDCAEGGAKREKEEKKSKRESSTMNVEGRKDVRALDLKLAFYFLIESSWFPNATLPQ